MQYEQANELDQGKVMNLPVASIVDWTELPVLWWENCWVVVVVVGGGGGEA